MPFTGLEQLEADDGVKDPAGSASRRYAMEMSDDESRETTMSREANRCQTVQDPACEGKR